MSLKYFERLKSKMHIFITDNNQGSKKAKDINKNVVDNELKYDDYKNFLFNRSCIRHDINRIQGKYYNIRLYRINKIYLFSYDDKKIFT